MNEMTARLNLVLDMPTFGYGANTNWKGAAASLADALREELDTLNQIIGLVPEMFKNGRPSDASSMAAQIRKEIDELNGSSAEALRLQELLKKIRWSNLTTQKNVMDVARARSVIAEKLKLEDKVMAALATRGEFNSRFDAPGSGVTNTSRSYFTFGNGERAVAAAADAGFAVMPTKSDTWVGVHRDPDASDSVNILFAAQPGRFLFVLTVEKAAANELKLSSTLANITRVFATELDFTTYCEKFRVGGVAPLKTYITPGSSVWRGVYSVVVTAAATSIALSHAGSSGTDAVLDATPILLELVRATTLTYQQNAFSANAGTRLKDNVGLVGIDVIGDSQIDDIDEYLGVISAFNQYIASGDEPYAETRSMREVLNAFCVNKLQKTANLFTAQDEVAMCTVEFWLTGHGKVSTSTTTTFSQQEWANLYAQWLNLVQVYAIGCLTSERFIVDYARDEIGN
jgi:hypothetical protein